MKSLRESMGWPPLKELVPLLAQLLPMSIALTVNAAAPSIDYPPKDQTVILYQQAAFGVIASGAGPFTYQWRKDDLPISGETKDQLVLGQPQFSDAGRYSVVGSNAEGSVSSNDAM